MMNLAIKMITITHFGAYFKNEENIETFHRLYSHIMADMDDKMDGKRDWGEDDPREQVFNSRMDEFKNIVKRIADNQRRNIEEGDYERADFLNTLLEYSDEDEEIMAQALTFIVGGFHTTGITSALCYIG